MGEERRRLERGGHEAEWKQFQIKGEQAQGATTTLGWQLSENQGMLRVIAESSLKNSRLHELNRQPDDVIGQEEKTTSGCLASRILTPQWIKELPSERSARVEPLEIETRHFDLKNFQPAVAELMEVLIKWY